MRFLNEEENDMFTKQGKCPFCGSHGFITNPNNPTICGNAFCRAVFKIERGQTQVIKEPSKTEFVSTTPILKEESQNKQSASKESINAVYDYLAERSNEEKAPQNKE